MQKARYLVALSCAYASAACGTELARAVNIPLLEAGTPGIPEKPPQCLSNKITDRLTYGSVSLPDGVRYKRSGYFFGFPQDDRIALSPSTNGAMVAWVNAGGTTVHVTPLATGAGGEIARAGADAWVDGSELSGLVALDDGFALLTRRPDPGEPVGDGMTQALATYLVRWQNGRELWAVPLTGTKSITNPTDLDLKRDFPLPSGISGRLAFNGLHYGAYFTTRGGAGDQYVGEHTDKFVQVDDNGQLVQGWRKGCRVSLGNRLVAEATGFVAFCMSDGTIEPAGLSVVLGPRNARRLAPEWVDDSYSGGNLGSAVKTSSGYLVAWASRGVSFSSTPPNPAYESHEPAVAIVDKDRNPVPPPTWPFKGEGVRPARDAVNVHAAPWGDKVLMVWETIESPQFRSSVGYSTGAYGGTHFRLVDAQGKPASEEESMPGAIAPNGPDDIVQFPNGDLGWAYVPEPRDFQTLVQSAALPNLPVISEINFVRLLYCTP